MIFDKNRYGFGVVGNTLVVMRNFDRDMKTREWLDTICHMEFTSVRGYITRERIQFFDGDYGTSEDVTTEMVDAAMNTYMRLYGASLAEAIKVPVYNGTIKGAEGEVWRPVLEFSRDINEWTVV